ncbi:MAG TPA: M50 family metallopeptidase [Patescibacteria group bacterium]|nr:M50 family metallopeptidase [Patescibacteria group bacterium]
MLFTIIVFIAILSVLVLIHEAGHYFAAKKLGVKVEEFGFGFPPRIIGKKIGETIYSLNLLPIGGFVKLFGEDATGGGSVGTVDEKALQAKGKDLKCAFFARPVWQRGSIVVAGVVMNFLLALVILTYLFAFVGVTTAGNKVLIVGIAKNSPAEKAGLISGDQIIKINNENVTNPDTVTLYTKKHLGQSLTLLLLRSKEKQQIIHIIPRTKYPSNEGAMGIAISTNVFLKKYPLYEAPFIGLRQTLVDSWKILQGLGQTINQVAVERTVPNDLAGPVGIAQLTGQFIHVGPFAVLSLLALLSLNLAVLNILPIPALDGGRLLFILIEGLTRKKVSPKIEGYIHAAGMIVLLILVALITLHDITRALSGQSLQFK